MANIREHNSWVHSREGEAAKAKAEDSVRMAMAKVLLLQPLEPAEHPVTQTALVVGGGIAGMTAALNLARQDFYVHLVEKKDQLAGIAQRMKTNIEGADVKTFRQDLIAKVENHKNIHLHLNTEVLRTEGFIGNFITNIKNNSTNKETKIKHGVVVIATGAEEFKPHGFYCYGEHPNILTSLELKEAIAKDKEQFKGIKEVVFIQCVGSRDEQRPYCSRTCCTLAIEDALSLKGINPDIDVYILHRDIRTYGLKEDFYTKARELNVKFIRFEKKNAPKVFLKGERIIVRLYEPSLKEEIELRPDFLSLSAAIVPNPDNEKLSQIFKVPLTKDRFFLEAHMKLRPVDFASDGLFMCGLAHGPKFMDESIAQAQAAASRAATILAKEKLKGEAITSEVYEQNCDGCGYCVDVCPFSAIHLFEYMYKGEVKKMVEVNTSLCKGCGVCMATCPKRGIMVKNFTLDILGAMVEASLVSAG
jgi:heterodisulfide reductase subunit A